MESLSTRGEATLSTGGSGRGIWHVSLSIQLQILLPGSCCDTWIPRLADEHLLEDLNHLEHTLGAPTNTTHAQMTHFTHYTLPNEKDLPRPKLELSTAALQRLCTILCDETQIYAQLLRVASNLNEHERQSTLQALRTQCPVSSSTLPCPPNNRLKLSESEQGQLHDTYFQRWGEEHGKDYGGNT